MEYNTVVDYYSCKNFSANFLHFLSSITDINLRALPWMPATRVNKSVLRHSCWFTEGKCKCKYNYSGTRWPPCVYPEWLSQLGRYVSSIAGEDFNSVNANFYADGKQGIGPHSDNEPLFFDHLTWESKETTIASISFGSSRTMEFKHKYVHNCAFKQVLHNMDILIMKGETQKHFQHSVPQDANCASPRFNLTFRKLKRHQAECPLRSH